MCNFNGGVQLEIVTALILFSIRENASHIKQIAGEILSSNASIFKTVLEMLSISEF